MPKKYIDADKLIAEIERKRDGALERQKNLEKIGQETVLNIVIAEELNMLISFIASLQQEQPVDIPSARSGAMGTTPPKFKPEVKPVDPEVDLEREVEKYLLDNADFVTKSTSNEMVNALARHFYELGRNQVLQELYKGKIKPFDKINGNSI